MDHNSLTNIRLIDFLSVLIMNKRHVLHDIESPILFNHSEILQFIEKFQKFANPEEIVKVFIHAGKFRLSLRYMEISQVPFQIEFFELAIESNSYGIVFYMMKNFHEKIAQNR